MQLQFEKTNVRCLRSVIQEVKDHEETLEIRISDGQPDIGTILGCWGQIVLRGKDWRSSGISTNGGIMTWVLYLPEDGSDMQCVEAWIPYQIKCDFAENERDGGIVVQPLLRSVDARSISARKIMLRADMGILCQAMVDGEIPVYNPGDMPEDVRLLNEEYRALLPKEMNEKSFLIDEAISFPVSSQQIDKIIYYHVNAFVTENKVMGDKIIFRGNSRLHILYLNEDGQLLTWDADIPFSQFAELGCDYTDGASANVIMAVTSSELGKGEGGYRFRAGLTGQYIIYDHECISVVKDAYSPNRTVSVTSVPLLIPSMLDMSEKTISMDCKLRDDCAYVADSVFYPGHPKAFKDGDQVTLKYSGTFRTLCQYADGTYTAISECAEVNDEVDADKTAKLLCSVTSVDVPQVMTAGSNMGLSAEMSSVSVWMSGQTLPMLTELELGECAEYDPERPGVVLRKAGMDTLWEIAKQLGSTVEMIMEANGLQSEPESDRMLLIPIL